jgi:hypothetical protein
MYAGDDGGVTSAFLPKLHVREFIIIDEVLNKCLVCQSSVPNELLFNRKNSAKIASAATPHLP